ncbi:hypothetical protein Anas_13364 [Armadillidium nasatum]|uniref:Uncharacterized protein n=1 Tax=Armadillidium nasatum TaxID=96803 RepID=A0A5N5SYB3_9CRUS|nr:hypothetical protein Anas_13364 [Armadillidium nasatum]
MKEEKLLRMRTTMTYSYLNTLNNPFLATEGSIQKELVRSACLVLIGHAIGTIVFIPILDSSINSEMFRQLAKSLPSLYFILLIFVRWVITQGRLEESSSVLQRSHKVVVEDSLRTKIASVYNDMRKCLSDSNCRGSALKQAVFPIIFARPMWRVFLPAILISVLQGSAIGFRLIHDPMPYQSHYPMPYQRYEGHIGTVVPQLSGRFNKAKFKSLLSALSEKHIDKNYNGHIMTRIIMFCPNYTASPI